MEQIADSYLTIKETGEGLYTESRSRFLAFAHHVADEAEVKTIVGEYRKKYYDARHVCYAYALGLDGNTTRQNDDGEPAGTAGQPIGRQLRAFNVTYALVVVVRYFGGVKLGTSRLGTAYKTAAIEALNNAVIQEEIVKAEFKIAVPYADADVAMRYVKEGEAAIVNREYTATDNLLTIHIRRKDEEKLRTRLALILTLRFIEKE